MAGLHEAKAARRVVSGAPSARPLSAYAGEYEHPGYGTLAIAFDADTPWESSSRRKQASGRHGPARSRMLPGELSGLPGVENATLAPSQG